MDNKLFMWTLIVAIFMMQVRDLLFGEHFFHSLTGFLAGNLVIYTCLLGILYYYKWGLEAKDL